MAEFSVRVAVAGDAEAIAHVHRLSRADYYDVPPEPDDGREEMWADLLDQPGRVTYVAETSEAIVGFVSARQRHEPPVELEMTAIYVLPSRHGQGIGSRLYDVFESQLQREAGGTLDVWAGNHRAVDFYTRRGWLPTSTTRPGPQGLDFVTYRLPVRENGG